MGILKFNNVGIKVISATVPKKVVKTRELTEYFSQDALEKFIEMSGIEERRFVESDQCASDLCYKSACNIFDRTDVKREDIDMLLFVTQTPDYKTPGTSIILQHKLGLSTKTVTYDLNKSCSGFIHGLLMAYTFLQLPEVNNIMLLAGDTLSKITSPQDKSTALLLGDGGIAAVITKGKQFGESFFSMNTDGSNIEATFLPAGGCRMPSSPETLAPQTFEDGSIRNLEQVSLNGMDVFSFAITELPRDIKRLLTFADVSIDAIDKYAFHQANTFMTEHIVKKAKADMSKLLRSIHKYGNTAGISIPLTMVENRDKINKNDSILMNAIGAGFVTGTVLLNVADCEILELDEL